MARCAFIGLGNMGHPMAGHLTKNGHEVTVFNRTATKAEAWAKEYGGRHAPTPRDAVAGVEFAFSCVGNDDDLRSVVFGEEGILAGLEKGAIFVDHTTASAAVARDIGAAANEGGIRFLDGPVSGGQLGAQNGQLTVMVGGDAGAFEEARPVIDSYARAVTLLGPVGSGQLCKMVNQIAVIGVIQGLSEALAFAGSAGLDESQVIDVISKGAAQSWQMENRGPSMIKGDFEGGFAVDWMRKDLRICLDEASRNGSRLPQTAMIEQFYAELQARGGGRWDNTSLIKLLKWEG